MGLSWCSVVQVSYRHFVIFRMILTIKQIYFSIAQFSTPSTSVGNLTLNFSLFVVCAQSLWFVHIIINIIECNCSIGMKCYEVLEIQFFYCINWDISYVGFKYALHFGQNVKKKIFCINLLNLRFLADVTDFSIRMLIPSIHDILSLTSTTLSKKFTVIELCCRSMYDIYFIYPHTSQVWYCFVKPHCYGISKKCHVKMSTYFERSSSVMEMIGLI